MDSGFTTDTPIEELRFGVRAYNRMKQAGINTVGGILDLTQDDLKQLEEEGNFLISCTDEIWFVLDKHGFEWYP